MTGSALGTLTVLLVGNSLTYFNDLPETLRGHAPRLGLQGDEEEYLRGVAWRAVQELPTSGRSR